MNFHLIHWPPGNGPIQPRNVAARSSEARGVEIVRRFDSRTFTIWDHAENFAADQKRAMRGVRDERCFVADGKSIEVGQDE